MIHFMNYIEFKYLIKNAQYETKYEPLISTKDDSIYGYEALSKFEINQETISTEEIFRKLHHNNTLFFELEKRNKQLQINNFFDNKKLFLNFDADIVNSFEQKSYWEQFLKNCNKDIVVEITENGSDDETSMQIIHNFSLWLKNRGIESALDDFAKEGSMFSFFLMDKSKYIKVDKSFLKQIKKNPNYIEYIKGILKTIKLNKQFSIIEGIELKEDYLFAKEIGFDYMQGYFFNNLVIIK
ncbi:EAL domain-containing protein [Poseidonibacter ostreae]|jgi:EAL domain-containing protein (putative c-di-GMP-specific phosphodiesterase class I)|uniref:EAL domain-containing protein n=2 Tax=Poseidonibacter ostreae TaxID=2654171 RepID=A0A6L4WQ32_9BACT|nr:EAL domain-containing protein [Poseidonibacter ostreae]KAB7886616.1 EAL domain-containing protein [Poseidonibacter ostreae]KAB7889226.1 EAL domain-containing protein [Poseidonibacter ostreae]